MQSALLGKKLRARNQPYGAKNCVHAISLTGQRIACTQSALLGKELRARNRPYSVKNCVHAIGLEERWGKRGHFFHPYSTFSLHSFGKKSLRKFSFHQKILFFRVNSLPAFFPASTKRLSLRAERSKFIH